MTHRILPYLLGMDKYTCCCLRPKAKDLGIDSSTLFIHFSNRQFELFTMPKGQGLTKPMKLSAELAEVVGKKEASRAECIKQLWAYLKKNNLQDPENKQYFTPDKKMAKIFGTERIRAFGMAKFLSAHLS